MINTEIFSKYDGLPYNIIGLDLTNNSNLELLNSEELFLFKQIFNDIKNCEEFLLSKQINNDIIILVISGHLSFDQLKTLKKYSQIDAIYLYSVSDDHKKDFKCIYTKTTNSNYHETFIKLLKQFWFLLGLVVVMILAHIYPPLGSTGGPLSAEYTIKWGGVVVISFFSGLAIPTKRLAKELLHIRLHIFVQCFSLVLIPFTVYGVCLLLVKTSLNKVLIGGILTTACNSTAISSAVSFLLFRSKEKHLIISRL